MDGLLLRTSLCFISSSDQARAAVGWELAVRGAGPAASWNRTCELSPSSIFPLSLSRRVDAKREGWIAALNVYSHSPFYKARVVSQELRVPGCTCELSVVPLSISFIPILGRAPPSPLTQALQPVRQGVAVHARGAQGDPTGGGDCCD